MPFFKLGEAFDELTSAVGAKDRALAGAKLVGKTLFNTGKLAVDVAVKGVEMQSGKTLKRSDLTDEQREKAEEINTKSRTMRLNSEIAEIKLLIKEKRIEIGEKMPDKESSRTDDEIEQIYEEDLSKEEIKKRLQRILSGLESRYPSSAA